MNYDKRNFTEEEIKQAVAESKSYAELARKLGYNDKTGHYITDTKKWVEKYNCNTSHFTGRSWNKGNFNYGRLKLNTRFKGGELLRFLLDVEKRTYKCECCGNTEWNGKPIPLQAHHIDGNHYNNEISNLQLLCPNCHAQTDSYCGKGLKQGYITDEQILEVLKNKNCSSVSEVIKLIGFTDTTWHRKRIKVLAEQNNISFEKKEEKDTSNFKEEKKEPSIYQINRENEFNKRKEYFSKINFKYGWLAQAEKDLGISHTQISRWLNKYMPELNIPKRGKNLVIKK